MKADWRWRHSLRGRLTVLLLGVVLLAAVFQGVSAYHTAQRLSLIHI